MQRRTESFARLLFSGTIGTMQLIHSLIAVVVGVSIAAIVISLIALRGNSWRSALGAFFVVNLAILGYSVGQLIRADATTLSAMELSVRLCAFSGLMSAVMMVEVFRQAARAPVGLLHWTIIAFTLPCALYALISPGGFWYCRLVEIDVHVMHWGEVLHVPIGRPDPLSVLPTLDYVLVGLRLGQLAWIRWRQGSRTHALLMAAAIVAFVLAVGQSIAVVFGVLHGPTYSAFAMLIIYVAAAMEAAEAQQKWIAERDESVLRVRESEGKLAALVGQGQTLSGILTPEGIVVLVNRRALELMGCKSEDVVGKPFPATAWWQHSSELQDRLWEAIERAAAGNSDRFQASHPLPDGQKADIDFSLTPYRDETGEVRWLIPEGRDITDLVRFERHARAEQRTDVIGQLAGGIAHDFNNMLTGILGTAELAKCDCDQPVVREGLDIIVEAAERAAILTRQLLTFARRGSVHTETFRLHTALTSTLELFRRMAGPNVVVVTRFEAKNDSIQGDIALVQSAMMNLLVNARDAVAANGTVTLTTASITLTVADASRFALPFEPGEYIQLVVEDTGTGIAAEVLPRIFEPFFTTKELGKGTGLGLATVVGCVRDHHGVIDVESKPGHGTCFSLHLPLSVHDASIVHQRVVTSCHAHGQLALVVDDEPIVRNSMLRLLSHLGFTVRTAEDSEHALSLLSELPIPPRVALLDLHMRGMNGCELASILRERFPELPIVLSSGNFGSWDLSTVRNDVRMRLLAKPTRREELHDILVELGTLSSS